MRYTVFSEIGERKVKVIERSLAINCQFCGASLACPPEQDFWFWLKCGDAIDFRKAHEGHGFPRMVGAEIKVVEKDE